MTPKNVMPADAQREFDELARKFQEWDRWFMATHTMLTNGWATSVETIDSVPPADRLVLIRQLAKSLQPTFDVMGPAPAFVGPPGSAAMSPHLLASAPPGAKPN